MKKNPKASLRKFCIFCNLQQYNVNSIEHHRQSPNNHKEWETTIKRNFEFQGDTLILTANELIGGLKTRLR
jgi:hypothetical protein